MRSKVIKLIRAVILTVLVLAITAFFISLCLMGMPQDIITESAIYERFIAKNNARIISNALNRYFADKGEYPEFLLGGRRHALPEWADPLLEGGYLKHYPRKPGCDASRTGIYHDPRRGGIVNLVSAPHDPFVEWVFSNSELMAEESGKLQALKELKATLPVILVAGGVEREVNGSLYSAIPSTVEKQAKNVLFVSFPDTVNEVVWDVLTLALAGEDPEGIQGNFGYVRGERMGGDEKSAFLWMYGMLPEKTYHPDPDDPGPTGHVGLDVLNAETGELVPDGIPDGICILYELRDGEVVNITRAEDM